MSEEKTDIQEQLAEAKKASEMMKAVCDRLQKEVEKESKIDNAIRLLKSRAGQLLDRAKELEETREIEKPVKDPHPYNITLEIIAVLAKNNVPVHDADLALRWARDMVNHHQL
jgi:predicted RNase H-like nuclease (RuvC/YqgF family)